MSQPSDPAGLRVAIERCLAELIDPGAGLDVMRMGLVRNLQVAGDGTVSLVFRPSSPVCPIAFSLAPAIREAVEAIPGVKTVRMRVENFKRAAELEALLAVDGGQ
jgi:metal-sulfur cluster biosynthetic enzyme